MKQANDLLSAASKITEHLMETAADVVKADVEKNVVFRIRMRNPKTFAYLNDTHAHLKIFVGPDFEHLAFAGDLTMRREEFMAFVGGLLIGLGRERVQMDAILMSEE